MPYAVRTPDAYTPGLGSFPFARRYSGNRCFFLFLRVLRCFSSPRSPRQTMDSSDGTQALPEWVSPFGYLRISGYLLLPAAFRSLSRPSSASGAKASALCSFLLNLFFDAFASGRFRCSVTYSRPCFSVRKVNCYAITETTRRHSLLVVPWSSNVCKSQASLIFAAALGHFPSN